MELILTKRIYTITIPKQDFIRQFIMKTVYYLQPSSFCFWVEKSILGFKKIIENHPNDSIYCVHALVHNPKVTRSFEEKKVKFIESLNEIEDPQAVIVFSAHGTKRSIIQEAKKKFKAVYNLECPFVSKIYTEADRYIQKWISTFFYIGKENHQEGKNVIEHIRTQWAQVFVFQDEKDIPQLEESTSVAVLSQTTLNFEHVQSILHRIKEMYPSAEIPPASDVCKATYDRQSVILQNIEKFETFIVIGGKESNNTRELYEIWIKNNKQTFYGESLVDIVQTPKNELFAYEKIAVTGGASTPQEDIQEVVDFFVTNGYKQEILLLK